jgi:hypothetical protein
VAASVPPNGRRPSLTSSLLGSQAFSLPHQQFCGAVIHANLACRCELFAVLVTSRHE